MNRDFVTALLQLNAEKQVPRDQLIHTVEDAIQSAYRRQPGDEDVCVRIDGDTGRIRVFRAKVAVGEVVDPLTEFSLDEAKAFSAEAVLGDLVEIEEMDPNSFGRIHAQTAKQVVLQRLREAERDVAFDQFASRDGELITGSVNRIEPRAIILELVGQGGVARAEAILATTEQSPLEHYRIGQNVKALVLEVRRGLRGPQLFVSRSHKNFLRRLFELEVPEIHNGTVEIKAIAREAGSRSKVAVWSRQEGLDPVGATVGQRGARVQAVVAELAGEKIDVIPWNDDPAVFVANALSPAQVIDVQIDEEHRIASVTVPERMLSLAIGREGQNARLAAKLSGWRIDIRSDVSVAEAARVAEEAASQAVAETLAEELGAGTAAVAVEEAAPAKAPARPRAKKAAAAVADEPAEAGPAEATKAAKPATKAVANAPATSKAVVAKAPAKPKAVAKVKPAKEPAAAAAVKAPARARAKKATDEVAS
jgi:N utilization substance protein A